MIAPLKTHQEHFAEHGWVLIDAPDATEIHRARAILEVKLHEFLKHDRATLESYHAFVEDDAQHTECQVVMTELFRRERFGPRIVAAQLEFFERFIGSDLNVQSSPYLRISRPQKNRDTVGYHRDTFYGGSPYELSVLVPYVDVDAGNAMGVLSGSHVRAEADFPFEQRPNDDPEVTKGSRKHQLGFLYAPKYITPDALGGVRPVPMRVGQLLLFSLSLVHGSSQNTGATTRWSSDVRVVNALANVDLGARPDYYEPLCRSAVSAAAQAYFSANAQGD